jgi:Zn-dependent oligopeptidase
VSFPAERHSPGDQRPVKETLSVITREGTNFPADDQVRMERIRTDLSLATQQFHLVM